MTYFPFRPDAHSGLQVLETLDVVIFAGVALAAPAIWRHHRAMLKIALYGNTTLDTLALRYSCRFGSQKNCFGSTRSRRVWRQ